MRRRTIVHGWLCAAWLCAVALSDACAASKADTGVVVIATGDIAQCGRRAPAQSGAEITAQLIETMPGTVLALGDLVYPNGRAEEFAECYEPTWGRFKDRTYPVPGNHEYNTPEATPYYDYWGARAGVRSEGYYTLALGDWLIVALNSNLLTGKASDRQEAWLQEQLKAHPRGCKLAFFHHPRYSSGGHGSNEQMRRLWRLMYEGGVDVALSGHDHNYERLAPMNAGGAGQPPGGIRQFVVGTGGAHLGLMPWPQIYSEFKYNNSHGVLRMTLREKEYEWEFLTAPDGKVLDSGRAPCRD